MPFIDSKVTVAISEEKKELLKSELGTAISILGKPESFLMIGFDDAYDLYMAGQKLEKGAFVSVSLLGNAPSAAYEQMTAKICQLYQDILDIPGHCVYVTYSEYKDWGWNGRNF